MTRFTQPTCKSKWAAFLAWRSGTVCLRIGKIEGREPTERQMPPTIDTTFDYIGLWGCDSQCRVRVFDVDAAPVVVLSELSSNEGTSVTNALETVASQVCERYRLDGLDVIWIEHYPDERTPSQRARGERDPIFDEHFSAVNFGTIERSARGWLFRDPRWEPLELRNVERLIGVSWTTTDG